MEKAWKFVLSPLQSENNHASTDSCCALGAILIIGIMAIVSLGVKLFQKVKNAVMRRKHRHEKVSVRQTKVVHA